MIHHQSGIDFFKLESLEEAGVFNAFISRHSGASKGPYSSLNLGLLTDDDPKAVAENDAAVRRVFGINKIVRARQVHGNGVIVIDRPVDNERAYLATEADALITDQPCVALAVLTADCFPVILADRSIPAVAMVHAGRAGVCKGVIERAVEEMNNSFGSVPQNLTAGVGPGIGPCCYKVDENIASDFRVAFLGEAHSFLEPSGEGLFKLDLFRAIKVCLERSGVASIERLDLCTSCNEDIFFSHRRDKGVTGRMINLVMIP